MRCRPCFKAVRPQVLAFLLFIPGAVLNTHLKDVTGTNQPVIDEVNSAVRVTRPGAQWLIVVCWFAIAGQAIAILLRFLNLTIIERYIGIVLILVSLKKLVPSLRW